MYSESLAGLFPDHFPNVVSDSDDVIRQFSNYGFSCLKLSDVISGKVTSPVSVILITCDPSLIPVRGSLIQAFGSSAVLIIPLLSFQATGSAIEYLAHTLKKVDFKAACTANLRIVEALERTVSPINVFTNQDVMSVDLSLSLEIALPKVAPNISIGEWVSLGQFLELGLVPNEGHTAFNVNGKMWCDGMAVAHHRHNLSEARPKAFEAWRILSDVHKKGGFPLELTISSSKMESVCTRDGVDILQALLPLTDEVFRGLLTEVAFASINAFTQPDWTVNSQLNEGAGGSHVALGTGVHAAHIDFVSTFAKVEIH